MSGAASAVGSGSRSQGPGWARRLVVLEDEPLVSALLTQTLQDSGFEVVACPDAISAKRKVLELDPDGVLIDINLGAGPNGIQFGEWLLLAHPHIVQIYLTGISDPRIWDLGESQGTLKKLEDFTFLAKDKISNAEELVRCVDTALQDGSDQPLSLYRNDQLLASLSKSELEILRLVSEGLTNLAIASKRGTTVRTVEQQLQSVYKALNIEVSQRINARVRAVKIYLKAAGE